MKDKEPRRILWYAFHDTRALFWVLIILGWCVMETMHYYKYGRL